MKQQSSQRLRAPWALDENEFLESARIAFPRPRPPRSSDDNSRLNNFVFISGRGEFGPYLKRRLQLTSSEPQLLIEQLLETLSKAGLVMGQEVEDLGVGWRIPAAAMRWLSGEGTTAYRDPIRVPFRSAEESPPNEFSIRFYRDDARAITGIRS